MTTTRARTLALGVSAALLTVGVTACGGSQLSPSYVQAANIAVSGQAPATNSGAGGVPGAAATAPATSAANPGLPVASSAAATPGGNAQATGGTQPGHAGQPAAGAGTTAGSCAGFRNQTGITNSTITIGNASDISGPVPGLFEAAQQATKAYVTYFNTTTNGICGRKLQLDNLDSRTDAGADQQNYTNLCESTFAAVGSMSAFDSGGAAAAQACGLPDIRTAAVTAARNACSTCFGAQATGPHEFSNAVPDYFVQHNKEATQKAAFLYLNAGAAAENAQTQQAVEAKRGLTFVYSSAIAVADFNYGPYVQQLKSKGVRWVQFLGAYQQSVRMAQAMQSAGYKPDVFLVDPGSYDQHFLQDGGSAVEGAVVYINFTPLEEHQPELELYKEWLQQVSPGATPTFFGMFAWSAAKLFVQEALALGGKLTRAALVAKVSGINNWTGGGMHVPMMVGAKHNPSCIRFLQVQGGRFVPLGGSRTYLCDGYSRA